MFLEFLSFGFLQRESKVLFLSPPTATVYFGDSWEFRDNSINWKWVFRKTSLMAHVTSSGPEIPAADLLKVGDPLRLQITWTFWEHPDFGCSNKVGLLALKVNCDLEFEIFCLCSPCLSSVIFIVVLAFFWPLYHNNKRLMNPIETFGVVS